VVKGSLRNKAKHERRHAGQKNQICHVCGKGFIEKQELKYHLRSHAKKLLPQNHSEAPRNRRRGRRSQNNSTTSNKDSSSSLENTAKDLRIEKNCLKDHLEDIIENKMSPSSSHSESQITQISSDSTAIEQTDQYLQPMNRDLQHDISLPAVEITLSSSTTTTLSSALTPIDLSPLPTSPSPTPHQQSQQRCLSPPFSLDSNLSLGHTSFADVFGRGSDLRLLTPTLGNSVLKADQSQPTTASASIYGSSSLGSPLSQSLCSVNLSQPSTTIMSTSHQNTFAPDSDTTGPTSYLHCGLCSDIFENCPELRDHLINFHRVDSDRILSMLY